MDTLPASTKYKNHRFPVEIISHAVWLYFRFCLSFRDVEELRFERGVTVTYEAIRKWCRKFGQQYANQLRRRRPRLGDKWHMDEVFLTIKGERQYFWRAVDQDGNVLDILVQRRRDKRAAKKFFRKLLKELTYVPRVIVTDKLKSYEAAKREVLPGGRTSPTPVSQQSRRELTPAHPPARAAHATVQVPGSCSAVPSRLRSYLPALPAPPASAVRARIPAGVTDQISELAGDPDSSPSRLSEEEVRSPPPRPGLAPVQIS
jgi:transposase-like protein